ncbi:hypothetical protein DOE51_08970 [Bdellovibrio sp. NC01]|nr:hypothetical protein DOE51_08970 [Bdellovibrio sp. NC01]
MNYGSDRYGSERYSGQNYGSSQGYNQGSRIHGDSYRSQRGMGRLSYDRDEDYSSAQSYGYGTDIDRFTKRSSDTEEGYGRDWNAYDSDRITTGPNYAGRGPKGFTRSDERIKEEINDALMRHAGIDASEIEVDVKDGVVTLTGTVPERRMKHMAEDISEKSFSVKDVTNNIRVKKEDRSSSSMSSSSGTSTSSSAASKKGGNPATTGSGH